MYLGLLASPNRTMVKTKATNLIDVPGLTVVNSREIASLWAGYGRILRLETAEGDRYIAKVVEPTSGHGISHQRKLHSYQVEAEFYKSAVPKILENNTCHVPTPIHIDCNIENNGGHLVLVMSDLNAEGYSSPRGYYDLQHAKVVLSWLAAFHASFWGSNKESIPGLWDNGCYWHLATRQEELEDMGSEWQQLKQHAAAIDAELNQGPSTILHGDAKAANFVFNKTGDQVAAYDFQYTGHGEPMKDVAYLLCSSVASGVLGNNETELLQHYHTDLTRRLSQEDAAKYSFEVMLHRLDLAVADYCRFMAGWGWWGSSSWAQQKTRKYLQTLSVAYRTD